jgi:hypothetical protein
MAKHRNMIQLKIYNYDKTSVITTLTDVDGLSVDLELMRGGKGSFAVGINDKNVTMDNFKKYNRVHVYDGTQKVFTGYISSWRFDSSSPERITVNLQHILEALNKRHTGVAETRSGNYGDSILSIITTYGTGLGLGVGTNTTTATGSLEFERENVLSAIQKLAEAGDIEFYVDENDLVQVRDRAGATLTGTKLRFEENQNNVNNIVSFDFLSDGTPIANRVIGISDALVQVANAATQQPLLEKVEHFSEAKTNGELLNLAENRLASIEESREIPKLTLDTSKISPYAISVGDTVGVFIQKGQLLSVDKQYRVMSVSYDYSTTGQPEVKLGFADEDSKALEPSLGRDIKKIQNRVSILEKI